MARSQRALRVLFFLAVSTVLVACGGGGGGGGSEGASSGSNSTNPPVTDVPNSYLPTSSTIAWSYNSGAQLAFNNDIVSNGTQVHSLRYPTSGKEYFVTAQDQVSLEGLFLPSINVGNGTIYTGDIRFSNLLAIFRQDWIAGFSQTVSGNGSINITPTYGNRTINFTGTITFVGNEDIFTAAGSFAAKRVAIHLVMNATVDGSVFTLPYDVTFWLVKDVGIVRRDQGSVSWLLASVTGIDISGIVLPSGGSGSSGGNSGSGTGSPPLPTASQLTVQETSLNFASVYGSSIGPAGRSLTLTSTNAHWQLTASDSWIIPDATSGVGSATVGIAENVSLLDAGNHHGTITVTNTDTQEQTVVNVNANVTLPVLSGTSSLVFDGSFGWGSVGPQSFAVNLNTGINSYPISSSVTFTDVGAIAANIAAPTIDALGNNITVVLDPSKVTEGIHTGQINLSVNVNGKLVTSTVAFTVKASEHILYASRDGIAFASLPSLNKLTQNVTVQDSYGLTNTNWTASSDQSWLSVTTGGVSGQVLALSANPAGLSTNTLHFATVTIASSNTQVTGPARIRVGIWVGSSDPQVSASVSGTAYNHIVADTIRPYLYAAKSNGDIDIYNAYTHGLINTITGVGVSLAELKISSDGSWLFAHDNTTKTIVRINLDNPTIRSSLPFFDDTTVGGSSTSGGVTYTYARPAGHPVLILDSGASLDVMTGAVFTTEFPPMFYHTGAMATSTDGRRLCMVDGGLSLYTVQCYAITFSSFSGGNLHYTNFGKPSSAGGDGWDIAMSDDGSLTYVVGSGQNGLAVYSVIQPTMQFAYFMPGYSVFHGYPMAMDRLVDGTILFGTSNICCGNDLWIYNPDLSIRKTMRAAGSSHSIMHGQLVSSGDGIMAMALTDDPQITFMRTD